MVQTQTSHKHYSYTLGAHLFRGDDADAPHKGRPWSHFTTSKLFLGQCSESFQAVHHDGVLEGPHDKSPVYVHRGGHHDGVLEGPQSTVNDKSPVYQGPYRA